MSSIVQGLQITILGIGVVMTALWVLSLIVDLTSKIVQKTERKASGNTQELAAVVAAISNVIPPERIKAIKIKKI